MIHVHVRRRSTKLFGLHSSLLAGLAGLAAFAILFEAEIAPVTYTVLMAVSGVGTLVLQFVTVEPLK
jgi:hypothetical protein